MRSLTPEQAQLWSSERGLKTARWGGGLQLSYREGEHRCIRLPLPKEATGVLSLAYVLLMTFLEEDAEENYEGGLLWLRSWDIWSATRERVGMWLMNQLRLGPGAPKSLADWPAIVFDSNEFIATHALLIQPMLFQWDAFYVPASAKFAAFISHDEHVDLLTVEETVASELLERFRRGGWEPAETALPFPGLS